GKLQGLAANQLESTTYLKYVDVKSWEAMCDDGSWSTNCGGSGKLTGWKLYVVIAGAGVALILLITAMVVCVRRMHKIKQAAKDAKAAELAAAATAKGLAPAIGLAKQYIYSAPVDGQLVE